MRQVAWAVLAVVLTTACGGHAGLTEVEKANLLSSCVARSQAGGSAFAPSACERIVETIAEDAANLGCDYGLAQDLLTAALRNDKAAVRRLERAC